MADGHLLYGADGHLLRNDAGHLVNECAPPPTYYKCGNCCYSSESIADGSYSLDTPDEYSTFGGAPAIAWRDQLLPLIQTVSVSIGKDPNDLICEWSKVIPLDTYTDPYGVSHQLVRIIQVINDLQSSNVWNINSRILCITHTQVVAGINSLALGGASNIWLNGGTCSGGSGTTVVESYGIQIYTKACTVSNSEVQSYKQTSTNSISVAITNNDVCRNASNICVAGTPASDGTCLESP